MINQNFETQLLNFSQSAFLVDEKGLGRSVFIHNCGEKA